MRWAKIGLVIIVVLAILPTIAKFINGFTESSNNFSSGKYEEYEIIITNDNINEILQELLGYIEQDEEGNITNYSRVEVDGNIIDVKVFKIYFGTHLAITSQDSNFVLYIKLNEPSLNPAMVTDYLKITLNVYVEEIPLKLTIIHTILKFIPLFIPTGLFIYLINKLRGKGVI